MVNLNRLMVNVIMQIKCQSCNTYSTPNEIKRNTQGQYKVCPHCNAEEFLGFVPQEW